MTTLYERLGGETAVSAAVERFYTKVLEDDRIKHFFEGVDMKKQHRMQTAFLTFAFGGPAEYSGRGMRAAHKRLVTEQGLNDTHYDAVIENLGATLKEMGVEDALIEEAAIIANSVRKDVLGQ